MGPIGLFFVAVVYIAIAIGVLVVLRWITQKLWPRRTAVSVGGYLAKGLHDGSMASGKSSQELASEVFDMLIEHAGAIERHRDSFIHQWGAVEVSFEGDLGHGGKFWINGDPWNNDGKPYINCYPEDLTPAREEMIETVNALLAALE